MARSGPPFQAFTVKFNGIADRIITAISVAEAFDPNNPPSPLPKHIDTQALWDTGASRSVISASPAKSLGLVPVGRATVTHAGGSGQSLTYLVNFRLPHQTGISGVLVTEFPGALRGFDAIVGMDIIGLGDLSITNVAGMTCVTFRTPSCVVVDYVAEFNRLQFAGVGRNDPCPCNSGRKFKKCHGA